MGRKRTRLTSAAFPTRGRRIRPTKVLGIFHRSQVSSIDATRKSGMIKRKEGID
jgi:hypothetical protein